MNLCQELTSPNVLHASFAAYAVQAADHASPGPLSGSPMHGASGHRVPVHYIVLFKEFFLRPHIQKGVAFWTVQEFERTIKWSCLYNFRSPTYNSFSWQPIRIMQSYWMRVKASKLLFNMNIESMHHSKYLRCDRHFHGFQDCKVSSPYSINIWNGALILYACWRTAC